MKSSTAYRLTKPEFSNWSLGSSTYPECSNYKPKVQILCCGLLFRSGFVVNANLKSCFHWNETFLWHTIFLYNKTDSRNSHTDSNSMLTEYEVTALYNNVWDWFQILHHTKSCSKARTIMFQSTVKPWKHIDTSHYVQTISVFKKTFYIILFIISIIVNFVPPFNVKTTNISELMQKISRSFCFHPPAHVYVLTWIV